MSTAADDLCELYLYKNDPEKEFPYKILKRQALSLAREVKQKTLEVIDEHDDETDNNPEIISDVLQDCDKNAERFVKGDLRWHHV